MPPLGTALIHLPSPSLQRKALGRHSWRLPQAWRNPRYTNLQKYTFEGTAGRRIVISQTVAELASHTGPLQALLKTHLNIAGR